MRCSYVILLLVLEGTWVSEDVPVPRLGLPIEAPQLQGHAIAVPNSYQGKPQSPPLLPFVAWFLCGKKEHMRVRKEPRSILTTSWWGQRTADYIAAYIYIVQVYAVAPVFHFDPDKNSIWRAHFITLQNLEGTTGMQPCYLFVMIWIDTWI